MDILEELLSVIPESSEADGENGEEEPQSQPDPVLSQVDGEGGEDDAATASAGDPEEDEKAATASAGDPEEDEKQEEHWRKVVYGIIMRCFYFDICICIYTHIVSVCVYIL
jgi:hypothetical protein